MEAEIRNKVQESGLVTLDLADFLPTNPLVGIDIADQLWQGLVLKEKDFRAWVSAYDWKQYSGQNIHIHCSADAIIPSWSYILIASNLHGIAQNIICGSKSDLQNHLILKAIENLNINEFEDGRIIIKGCAEISKPEIAMTALALHLQGVAKSIMYGEPCSTVPIFKRKIK